MRRLAAAVACVSVLGLAAPAALGQPVAQRPQLSGDIAGFSGDPGALPSAIDHIEQATGGVVTEARFANVNGVPGYDAAVAKGGAVTLMRVAEPSRGVVVLTGDTVPVWMMHWRARRDVHFAVHAPISLSAAVRSAEKAYNGEPAVAAGIATSASAPDSDVHAYNVLLLRHGGSHHRVAIDSATGEVIANPSALANWP